MKKECIDILRDELDLIKQIAVELTFLAVIVVSFGFAVYLVTDLIKSIL